MKKTFLIAFMLSLTLVGCFSRGRPPNRAVGYQTGEVQMREGSYGVGDLPAGWQRSKVSNYKTVSFYHPQYQSSLMTDAFCDRAYEDAPLEVLTGHLQFAVKDRQISSHQKMMLDGREALREVARGKVEGVPVVLDTVVIKKNNCLFDFALIAKPEFHPEAALDFERFYQGFRYRGEP